jgi:hypothetical protein
MLDQDQGLSPHCHQVPGSFNQDQAKSRATVFSAIKIFGLPSVREQDFTGLGSDVVAISSEVSLQVLTTLPEGAMLEWVPTFRKADLSNHRGYGLVSIYLKKGSRKPSEEIPT